MEYIKDNIWWTAPLLGIFYIIMYHYCRIVFNIIYPPEYNKNYDIYHGGNNLLAAIIWPLSLAYTIIVLLIDILIVQPLRKRIPKEQFYEKKGLELRKKYKIKS